MAITPVQSSSNSLSAGQAIAQPQATCQYPGCYKPVYPGSDYCSKNHLRNRAKAESKPQKICAYPGCSIEPLPLGSYCTVHVQEQSHQGPQPLPSPAKGFGLGSILTALGLGRFFSSSPSTQAPTQTRTIKFYEKGQPYYEFTNFAPYPVRYNQKDYPTSEHLFQSLKFENVDDAERIRTQPTPRGAFEEAKKYEQRVRKGWAERRLNVQAMEHVLLLKFTQHEQLKKMLLETGDLALIEDSPTDAFWGIGSNGGGKNELGRALEKIRKTLRQFDYH